MDMFFFSKLAIEGHKANSDIKVMRYCKFSIMHTPLLRHIHVAMLTPVLHDIILCLSMPACDY